MATVTYPFIERCAGGGDAQTVTEQSGLTVTI